MPSRRTTNLLGLLYGRPPKPGGGQPGRRLQWAGATALVRRGITRMWDPVVRITMYDRDFAVPLSSDLPAFERSSPWYGTNAARIFGELARGVEAPTCIDIGANIGDTAHLVKQGAPTAQVLCIEGDRRFFDLLRRNIGDVDGIECVHAFVSDRSGELIGHFVTERGTGHIDASRPSDGPAVTTVTLGELAEQHPRFARPLMLKTDTDGFDFAILSGSLAWIAASQPVIFMEYQPAMAALLAPDRPDGPQTLQALADSGYRRALVWDHSGLPMSTLDLTDVGAVADLDLFCRLRRSFYTDLCIFPQGQETLAEAVWDAERAHFTQRFAQT